MVQEVLNVEGVSKKYCGSLRKSMLYGLTDSVRQAMGLKPVTRLRAGEFWALRNISFKLNMGEVLGVTGRNGSGKTTLMRIIAGIYPFDTGQVTVNGKVSVVFATSMGMHPHYSGRENIYLMAAMYGMQRQVIAEHMDEIIAFSELGNQIDRPMGTYSSGMKARLGYSVAFASNPDIFIIDEGIAVGDRAFKDKCYGHIKELSKRMAIVFVSGSISKIKKLSTHLLVLDKGELVFNGAEVGAGLDRYLEILGTTKQKVEPKAIRVPKTHSAPEAPVSNLIEIVSIHIPKTAGTSFRNVLDGQYEPGAVARLDINNKLQLRVNRKILKTARVPKDVKVIHGHFVFDVLRKFFALKDDVKVVTWLRDPVERVVSNFYYLEGQMREVMEIGVNRRNLRATMQRSLLEYARSPLSRNVMSAYLAGIPLEELFFIGLTDRFEDDLLELSRKLQWAKTPNVPKDNAAPKKRPELPIEVYAEIAELNSDDMALYARALELRKIEKGPLTPQPNRA